MAYQLVSFARLSESTRITRRIRLRVRVPALRNRYIHKIFSGYSYATEREIDSEAVL